MAIFLFRAWALIFCAGFAVRSFILPVHSIPNNQPRNIRPLQVFSGGSMSWEQIKDEFSNRGHLFGYGVEGHVPSVLQNITAQRKKDVEEQIEKVSEEELTDMAAEFEDKYGGPLNLFDRIQEATATEDLEEEGGDIAIACEFKRASPSKGDINLELDPGEQAVRYAAGGAAVLSVLTEPAWFKGSLQDLRAARRAAQGLLGARRRPAVLRKDFVVDPYQVLEARAWGADTLLLMVSCLPVNDLWHLLSYARSLGMEPLVEVATPEEMDIALDVGARVIGVNNRNLHDMSLDPARTELCAARAAKRGKRWGPGGDFALCSLSGIFSREDMERYRDVGCSLALVGEALMRAPDPRATLRELLGKGGGGGGGGDDGGGGGDPVVAGYATSVAKVCGVTNAEDALAACQAGANLVGVIFAPSKRQVTVDQAREVVAAVRRFGERDGPAAFPAAPPPPAPFAPSPPEGKEAAAAAAAAAAEAEAKEEEERGRRLGAWQREWAVQLERACRRTPLVVGVFQDQPAAEVARLCAAAGVDLAQLHGDEPLEACRQCGVPAIKVLHIPAEEETNEKPSADDILKSQQRASAIMEQLRPGYAAAFLLDTSSGTTRGGTGRRFDWGVARALQARWGLPVLVAGGLGPDSVEGARRAARPWGVDVSSGIEEAVGKKDHEAMRRYLSSAKKNID